MLRQTNDATLLVDAIRARYPNPSVSSGNHMKGAYCVLGAALQYFHGRGNGRRRDRFPTSVYAHRRLEEAGISADWGDLAAAMLANDDGAFDTAWECLEKALSTECCVV